MRAVERQPRDCAFIFDFDRFVVHRLLPPGIDGLGFDFFCPSFANHNAT
jgi:hypothetical protein